MVSPLNQVLAKHKHLAMGILNITPDSFSDGGQFNHPGGMAQRIEQLRGADVIDIGAESTAPHNPPIGGHEEYRRFRELRVAHWPWHCPISIDTYRPRIFHMLQDRLTAPLIFNDVSGQLDGELVDLLHRHPRSPYVFVHNLAPKRKLASHHFSYPYEGSGEQLLRHLREYFARAYEFWRRHRLANPLLFDVGFGFSKTYRQNWFLIEHLPELIESFPQHQCWLIGLSRKSFLCRRARETGQDCEELHRQLIQRYRKQLCQYPLIVRLHQVELFAVTSSF